MGQKISPTSFRTGIQRDWASRWFGGRRYPSYLKDDLAIRHFLDKKLRGMSVDRVHIERGNSNAIIVTVYTARPGLLIGKGGSGIEEIKRKLHTVLKRKASLKLEIQEIKNPEASARIMAESMAEQTERRIPFRRVMKQTVAKIMASRQVKGVKIQLAGRLDGAEIARTEHMEEGSLPLQTLRADIDYAKVTALTTYGTIGIKVWIYRGQSFDKRD